uniref:Uncharacterized protein n=1 Tax=Panthera leo TaxID=9689 RepID=A0A8C8WVA2_PANLE
MSVCGGGGGVRCLACCPCWLLPGPGELSHNHDIEVESKKEQLRFQSQALWAEIPDKATEYIQHTQRKNHTHQQDTDDLEWQNARSNVQIQTNYPCSDNHLYTNAKGSTTHTFDRRSDSSSMSEGILPLCLSSQAILSSV